MVCIVMANATIRNHVQPCTTMHHLDSLLYADSDSLDYFVLVNSLRWPGTSLVSESSASDSGIC